MHIFIDEAGQFLPPSSTAHTHSLVLALIIPSGRHDELCYGFLRIRDAWPTNPIEVKGSTLTEEQTAQVARLLAEHEVLIEFQAVDMALHPNALISDFKERQAVAVTSNVTSLHQPTMVRQLEDLATEFRTMPNQLFIQAFLTIHLVIDTIQDGTLYYVQRSPTELGSFRWVIDRKDRDLTAMERAWTTLILPAGESESTTRPFKRLTGADYSHFAKYEVTEATAGPEMARHMAWLRETYGSEDRCGGLRCLDWKQLLAEERLFADSKDHLGVQLADITATTIRRAFNNHLRPEGWEPFGHLFAHHSGRKLSIFSGTTAGNSGICESKRVRTTLDLDDDIHAAVKLLAARERTSRGKVVSALVRRALEAEGRMRNGVLLFDRKPGAKPITLEMVNELRD